MAMLRKVMKNDKFGANQFSIFCLNKNLNILQCALEKGKQ